MINWKVKKKNWDGEKYQLQLAITTIPITPIIIIGALGTVAKGLIQGLEDLEIRGRMATIQTTALLSSARILRRVLETWGDLMSLKLQWETIS